MNHLGFFLVYVFVSIGGGDKTGGDLVHVSSRSVGPERKGADQSLGAYARYLAGVWEGGVFRALSVTLAMSRRMPRFRRRLLPSPQPASRLISSLPPCLPQG